MSTNGINVCEEAEMADYDGDKVVTMMDVLKEQEDFEEDANAVLGASDDKNCTYSKGYVKRQAIYACMSCCTDAKNDPSNWAGVCLACSLTCHENHELIELYTKRNFRCDCGNPKFSSHPCQFTPNKTDLNVDNIYNQNFSGVYCICHRPYPDPESTMLGDMIQCIICEDWLHSDHLDAVVPSNEQYSEMICKICMDKNEFLHDYSDLVVNKENIDLDISNISSEANSIANCNGNSNKEMVGNESIVNLKSVDSLETIKSESIEVQHSIKEEQTYFDTTETDITLSDMTQTDIILNEGDICNLKYDKKTEAEQTYGTQPKILKALSETIQESNANTIEKQSSLIVEKEPPDNRSQEELQEDLLLADPMDTNFEQKHSINDNVSSNKALKDRKNFESEVMEISVTVDEGLVEEIKYKDDLEHESKSQSVAVVTAEVTEDIATNEESKNVATAEKLESRVKADETENLASTEQSKNMIAVEMTEKVITEKFENVSSTELSGSRKAENVGNTKDPKEIPIPTVEQSKTTSIPKQSANNPTSTELEQTLTDRSVSVSTSEESHNMNTTKQTDQLDKNISYEKNVSVNENNTVSKKNRSFEEENSTDIVMDENDSEDTVKKDIQRVGTEINSKCDYKLPDKTIETDISKRKLSTDDNDEIVEVKKSKLEVNKCIKPRGTKKVYHGATFWPSNFRHKLCTCNECVSMYKDLSVLFLIDPDDTVTAYERLGKEKTDGKPATQYEKGMAALSSLGRVQQINALTEYTKLRDKLLDFLKTFKDKKVIVKEEDIKAFFAGMKPVREPDGVYFCR